MENKAKEYGQAFFDTLREEELDAAFSFLAAVEDTFEKEPEFLALLEERSLDSREKGEMIKRVYESLDKRFVPFLLLLSDRHLLGFLGSVIRGFDERLCERRGIKRGYVYSSTPLEKGQIAELEKRAASFFKGSVRLENRLDRRLLGGLKLSIDGKVLDGSINGLLEQVEQGLLKGREL